MSTGVAECGTCGSGAVRRLAGGTVRCDACGGLEFGTCVECGDHDAETSRVVDGDLRPVCYLCKSV